MSTMIAPTETFRLHNETGVVKLVADGYELGDLANRVYIGTGAPGVSLSINEAEQLHAELGQLIERLK